MHHRSFWRLLAQLIDVVRACIVQVRWVSALLSNRDKRNAAATLTARLIRASGRSPSVFSLSFHLSILYYSYTHARECGVENGRSPRRRNELTGKDVHETTGNRRGSTSRDASPPRFPASPAAAAISPFVSAYLDRRLYAAFLDSILLLLLPLLLLHVRSLLLPPHRPANNIIQTLSQVHEMNREKKMVGLTKIKKL